MPRIRLFGWLIILFNVYYLYQMSKAIVEMGDDDLAVGVYAIMAIVVWALLNVILYVLYRVTAKRNSRPCPACGSGVKIGITVCQKCNFDFIKNASGSQGN